MTPAKMMVADMNQELARLGELSLNEMRSYYCDLTGIALPKFMRRKMIELALAHAMQSAALGGFDRETLKRLDELVATTVPSGTPQPKPTARKKKLKAGTKLIRQWHGRLYEVEVTPTCFAWNGRTWRSLTEIATAITGTKWNGWVFFGITKTASPRMSGHHARAIGGNTKSRRGAAPRNITRSAEPAPRDEAPILAGPGTRNLAGLVHGSPADPAPLGEEQQYPPPVRAAEIIHG